MQAYLTLVRRELGSYFYSLAGYVTITIVLFLLGLSFVSILTALNNLPSSMRITELFYNTMYFWLIILLAAPIITMRTFALEKFSGTYETLMTAPVGDAQVVLAKFSGALLFYVILWLPLLGCLFIVRHYTNDASSLDPGGTAATFLGIILLGALYMSLGCFASSLTRSQIVAAMISLALGITLFMLGVMAYSNTVRSSVAGKFFGYLAMPEHMQNFARGVVDTRCVCYYASLTAFFLFLTVKAVESRRWK